MPLRGAASRAIGLGAALLAAYALAQFKPGDTPTTYLVNWIPFKGQVGTLAGMSDILETMCHSWR